MKNLAIGLLAAATAGLAVLCIHQHQILAAQSTQIQSLQASLTDEHGLKERTQSAISELKEEKETLVTESARLRQKVASLAASKPGPTAVSPSASSPSATPKNPFGNFAEIMKDPAMRQLVVQQQRALYQSQLPDLQRRLGLTAEQGQQLLELLVKKQVSQMDKRLSTGKVDASATSDADAEIKSLLGDAKYQQLQDYQASLPNRMQVNAFKQQLAASSYPLQDYQSEQLVRMMSEEQKAIKSNPMLKGGDPSQWDDQTVQDFSTQAEQANQRVVTRAQSILSPDQLTALRSYLDNQLALQKMGLKMAGKMFQKP